MTQVVIDLGTDCVEEALDQSSNVYEWTWTDNGVLVTNVKAASGLKSGPVKVEYPNGVEHELGRKGVEAEILSVHPDGHFDVEEDG